MILYALSLGSSLIAVIIALQDIRATIVVLVFFLILILMLLVYKNECDFVPHRFSMGCFVSLELSNILTINKM